MSFFGNLWRSIFGGRSDGDKVYVTNAGPATPTPIVAPQPEPVEELLPEQSPPKTVEVDGENPITLVATSGCTDAEKAGLKSRQDMLNKVIVSKFFENTMKGFSSVKCLPEGMSLDDFIRCVREPRTLQVDYYTDTDPDDENVDGYEEEDEPGVVHLHREALVEFEFSEQDEVSCMGHELGHVCGGTHIGNSPTAFNLTTCCYRINQAIDAWRGEA